jgi:hypothetical protein
MHLPAKFKSPFFYSSHFMFALTLGAGSFFLRGRFFNAPAPGFFHFLSIHLYVLRLDGHFWESAHFISWDSDWLVLAKACS